MPEASADNSRPVTLAVANQKGGVGKTTTAVNLSAGLTLRGYRVLLVDLDIQASASHTMGAFLGEAEAGIAEVMLEEAELGDVICQTTTPNLHLAPSGETIVKVDLSLAATLGREEALKRAIDSLEPGQFDFVIVDTSPYLGLLTVNALVAAQYVVVPVTCEYLPLLGLKLFLGTLKTIQRRLNPDLEILGYLLTMYDKRESITREVADTMRHHFGEQVFKRPIRVNTRHKSCPSRRQTTFQYEPPSGKGPTDYRRLTRAVLERLGMPISTADLIAGAESAGRAGEPGDDSTESPPSGVEEA